LRKGRIDECRGRYIFGWAIAVEAGAHCVVSVTDASGAMVASTVADAPRPDLVAVGNGRNDFAFHVAVPLGVAPGPVQVLADGIAFPESPLHLDEGVIDGCLSVRDGVVSGWICSRGTVPVTKPVTLIDQDGAVVLTLPTRLGPADVDPLFRPGRFSAELPASCFGRPELVLRAKVGEAIVAACVCAVRGWRGFSTGSAGPAAWGGCFRRMRQIGGSISRFTARACWPGRDEPRSIVRMWRSGTLGRWPAGLMSL
jgi:hypothetical protein